MDRRAFLAATTALVLAPEAAARRLGGTPLALVTADLESRIVAVHLTSGDVVGTIQTLPGPRSIERVGETAVVAHTTGDAVSVVDSRSLQVRRVIRGLDEPRYTAAWPDGRHAFVTESGSGSLAVVDVLRGRVVRRLRVGGPARHLSLAPSGRRLWVALGTKAERIAIVGVADPRRPTLLGSFRVPFLVHDVGFGPRGGPAWVTSGNGREVALVDPRTLRPTRRLRAGAPPQHVTFSGRLAYVTSGADGTLRTHEASTGRLLRSTRIPRGSYNVQEGAGVVLMPSLSEGTLCVADGRGRVRTHVDVARSSHDACFVMSP